MRQKKYIFFFLAVLTLIAHLAAAAVPPRGAAPSPRAAAQVKKPSAPTALPSAQPMSRDDLLLRLRSLKEDQNRPNR